MARLQRFGQRNTGAMEMTRYSDIIKQGRKEEAVNTETGKAVNNDIGKKVNTESGKNLNDDLVNITIKVPRQFRQYWTSQCKLEGLTMTQVLVEALVERFGKPK
jgi:hypothetical protein